MQITEAFYCVDASHIDRALEADPNEGFPQDIFGLLRVFLRTLAIMEMDSPLAASDAEAPTSRLQHAVTDRLEVLVELEERRLSQLDEGAPCISGIASAFH